MYSTFKSSNRFKTPDRTDGPEYLPGKIFLWVVRETGEQEVAGYHVESGTWDDEGLEHNKVETWRRATQKELENSFIYQALNICYPGTSS